MPGRGQELFWAMPGRTAKSRTLRCTSRRRRSNMRHSLLALLFIIALCGQAFAGPPIAGTYTRTDIGGSVPPGRYTEGWNTGGGSGGALLAGATLNCGSWDGANFGLVWRYTC